MIADIAKGAAVLFVAAIVQVTLLSQIDVFHGAPGALTIREGGYSLRFSEHLQRP